MPTIFILDVPEFEPIVTTARRAGMQVRKHGDYLEAHSATSPVVLERYHTQVRPAIWFASLTGGFVGSIARFDHEVLQIEEAD